MDAAVLDPAAGPHPGYGFPPGATTGWAPAPQARGRSGAQLAAVLVLIAMVAAGVFLYLRSGQEGLGSGTHTVASVATLGGYAQNTNPELQSAAQVLQSAARSSPTTRIPGQQQVVIDFYGSTDGTGTGLNPNYLLVAASFDHALTISDLQSLGDAFSGFDYATSSAQNVNGVSFHCGPLTGSGFSSACIWVDGNVFGLVAGASGTGTAGTLAAAEEARGSVER